MGGLVLQIQSCLRLATSEVTTPLVTLLAGFPPTDESTWARIHKTARDVCTGRCRDTEEIHIK